MRLYIRVLFDVLFYSHVAIVLSIYAILVQICRKYAKYKILRIVGFEVSTAETVKGISICHKFTI